MANQLHLTCENPEELLNAGAYGTGALIRIQTSATEAGTYADVTGTGSTPTITLVSGTRSYEGYDPAGTTTSWYRTRYENLAGDRLSVDWAGDPLWATRTGHAPFQVAGEEAGYICSIYDVKQRLGIDASNKSSDEDILEYIRAVTDEIESLTGRDFTGDQSDVTFQQHSYGTWMLRFPKGIQSITTLSVATQDQPATGGVYTALAASSYYLDPPPTDRDPFWPATRVCLTRTGGGYFYRASYGVQIVGRRGFATVPPNIARIGATAVVNQFLTKGSDGPRAVVGPDGRTTILRDISPADWAYLDRLSDVAVA